MAQRLGLECVEAWEVVATAAWNVSANTPDRKRASPVAAAYLLGRLALP